MALNHSRVLWSWIHLSDIHFTHGRESWAFDQGDVARQTLADINDLVEEGYVPRPSAILVTGDVAFSGGIVSANEYTLALDFIEGIRASIKSDLPVYVVPGNHDVQRTPRGSGGAYRLIDGLRESREDLDTALANDDDRASLEGRFANYAKFCEDVGSPGLGEIFGVWRADVSTTQGRPIRLIGWNTAILSNDDEDEGRLRLGKGAINLGVASRERDGIVIALTHHPTSWLEPREGFYAAARIFRDVDVHLHGHIHAPDSASVVRDSGQRCVIVTAGALHAEEDQVGAQTPHAYNIGAIVEAPGGSVELRVWPRRWSASQATWVADTDHLPSSQRFISHRLSEDMADAASGRAERGALRGLAEELSSRAGRRRTAYPTDLSINELFLQDLIIPARLSATAREGVTATTTSVREAISSEPTPSMLILGEPGSGKTVIAYEISRILLERPECCPLFVDLTKLSSEEPQFEEVLSSLQRPSILDTDAGTSELVFIVDGVDEALAAGVDRAQIASRLAALSDLAPLIVFCRRHDFEAQLAAMIRQDLFDSVRHVHNWSLRDFTDFIRRLVAAGYLDDDSLIGRVANDSAMMELVRRPLRARMLTYVSDGGSLPEDVTALYAGYLDKLASVTDGRIYAARCAETPAAMTVWRRVAWQVFRTATHASDDMPTERLFDFVPSESITPECASRVLAGVIEVPAGQGARFIHYSFFEFLVAQYLALALAEELPGAPGDAAQLLSRDLPLEIRRHLVRLLRGTASEIHKWPSYLASVYDQASELDRSSSLVARNLIAYIACRLEVPADQQLLAVLESEDQPFLRNSLLWALTRCNNMQALMTYLRELQDDDRLASLNRGYLLYYYGDMPGSAEPPHADDAPYASWEHTRGTLNQKYDSYAYGRVPPARKAIDMFTFCDIASIRTERLTNTEYARFERLIDELRSGGLPSRATEVLALKLNAVRPS